MRHSTYRHCNVLVGDEIFVMGGYASDNRVEVYNLPNGVWYQRAREPHYMPGAPSCAAVGTDVYVHYQASVYRYNTVENAWSTVYTGLSYVTYHSALMIV